MGGDGVVVEVYAGLRMCVVFEEMMIEKLERKGVWRSALREQLKESWQATSMLPIRLRNSCKSSCPSQLRSNFFIMRSRTLGSFWYFVNAASSVFMKVRNSVLDSV